MSEKRTSRFMVGDQDLNCVVCGYDRFWTRTTLMNTPGATLFGVEWANHSAENYICDKCGYIHWFFDSSAISEPPETYSCAVCDKDLSGSEVVHYLGKPYCEPHYEEALGEKKTARGDGDSEESERS